MKRCGQKKKMKMINKVEITAEDFGLMENENYPFPDSFKIGDTLIDMVKCEIENNIATPTYNIRPVVPINYINITFTI